MKHCITTIGLIFVVISTFARDVQAQASKNSMVFLLKTDSDTVPNDLEKDMKKGIKKSGIQCSNIDRLKATPITSLVYDSFDDLINEVKTNDGVSPSQLRVAGRRAELIAFRKPVLIISKEDPTDDLLELEVDYVDAGKKTYKPKPRGTKGEELTVMTSMQYQLELPETDYPKSYRAKFVDKTGKELKPLEEVLETKRFYKFILEDFKGDIDNLAKYFANPNNVGNAATFKTTAQQTFVLADFSENEPEKTIQDVTATSITLRIAPLNATRVWVLFPLTKEDADREFKKYRNLGKYGTSTAIRDSKAIFETDKTFTVKPGEKPVWFELNDKSKAGEFVRKIDLMDAPGLRKAYPDVYYLVVWEFEPQDAGDSNDPVAIRVKNQENQRVYVLARKVEGWSDGLTKAVGEQK